MKTHTILAIFFIIGASVSTASEAPLYNKYESRLLALMTKEKNLKLKIDNFDIYAAATLDAKNGASLRELTNELVSCQAAIEKVSFKICQEKINAIRTSVTESIWQTL